MERNSIICVTTTWIAEDDLVPTYILLSTLTAEGRKTVKSKPDRIKEVNREVEALGAKVLAQYAVLGRVADLPPVLGSLVSCFWAWQYTQ